MKKFSIDNGITFIDFENVTEDQRGKIDNYWNEIINFMDDEDREETNNVTEVYTDDVEGKINYIWDYLQIAKDDLILG